MEPRRRRPSRADVEGVQPDERLSLLPLPPMNIAALWALAVTRAEVRKCSGRCGSLSADVARLPQQSSSVVTRSGEDEAELSHGLILGSYARKEFVPFVSVVVLLLAIWRKNKCRISNETAY